MRLVHQPPTYVSGALMKHWLIRGEAHQYINHIVCFNTKDSHHPNKHTILYIFRAPGYNSLVPLSWYKHWLVSAHRSAITQHLPQAIHDSDHPFNPSTTCWKVRRWRITDLSLTLYTYSSFNTVYQKFIDTNTDLYRTPYPQPPLNLEPLFLLHPLLIPPTPFQTPFQTPHPSANHYRPVNHLYGPLQNLIKTSYPLANHYRPVNRLYRPPKDLLHPL